MLRTSLSRAALTVAFGCAPAPAILAEVAAADDALAGGTFTIELTLDQLLVEVAETDPAPAGQTAAASDDAPFADQPAFALGAPRTDAGRAMVFDEDAFETRCAAGRCSDLAASFAVKAEGDDVNLSFGATAGVADRLSSLSSSAERSSWYLFVAADAQAMSWSFAGRQPNSGSGVKLDDMRLLGDVQAGLGGRVAGGDLAMGFVSREVSHMGASRQENFVGLTFGWDGT
jgi:hypothetical protein